jgi:hypothetical protein
VFPNGVGLNNSVELALAGYFVFVIGIPTYSISDSNSVSIYIVIHFDFDDLMKLRTLQLMVLISCVFSVCHLIIIDVTMYYVTCFVSCKSSSF